MFKKIAELCELKIVRIASLSIALIRVRSYWLVSQRSAFVSIRIDSLWIRIGMLPSHVVRIGLYWFVLVLIASYRILIVSVVIIALIRIAI